MIHPSNEAALNVILFDVVKKHKSETTNAGIGLINAIVETLHSTGYTNLPTIQGEINASFESISGKIVELVSAIIAQTEESPSAYEKVKNSLQKEIFQGELELAKLTSPEIDSSEVKDTSIQNSQLTIALSSETGEVFNPEILKKSSKHLSKEEQLSSLRGSTIFSDGLLTGKVEDMSQDFETLLKSLPKYPNGIGMDVLDNIATINKNNALKWKTSGKFVLYYVEAKNPNEVKKAEYNKGDYKSMVLLIKVLCHQGQRNNDKYSGFSSVNSELLSQVLDDWKTATLEITEQGNNSGDIEQLLKIGYDIAQWLDNISTDDIGNKKNDLIEETTTICKTCLDIYNQENTENFYGYNNKSKSLEKVGYKKNYGDVVVTVYQKRVQLLEYPFNDIDDETKKSLTVYLEKRLLEELLTDIPETLVEGKSLTPEEIIGLDESNQLEKKVDGHKNKINLLRKKVNLLVHLHNPEIDALRASLQGTQAGSFDSYIVQYLQYINQHRTKGIFYRTKGNQEIPNMLIGNSTYSKSETNTLSKIISVEKLWEPKNQDSDMYVSQLQYLYLHGYQDMPNLLIQINEKIEAAKGSEKISKEDLTSLVEQINNIRKLMNYIKDSTQASIVAFSDIMQTEIEKSLQTLVNLHNASHFLEQKTMQFISSYGNLSAESIYIYPGDNPIQLQDKIKKAVKDPQIVPDLLNVFVAKQYEKIDDEYSKLTTTLNSVANIKNFTELVTQQEALSKGFIGCAIQINLLENNNMDGGYQVIFEKVQASYMEKWNECLAYFKIAYAGSIAPLEPFNNNDITQVPSDILEKAKHIKESAAAFKARGNDMVKRINIRSGGLEIDSSFVDTADTVYQGISLQCNDLKDIAGKKERFKESGIEEVQEASTYDDKSFRMMYKKGVQLLKDLTRQGYTNTSAQLEKTTLDGQLIQKTALLQKKIRENNTLTQATLEEKDHILPIEIAGLTEREIDKVLFVDYQNNHEAIKRTYTESQKVLLLETANTAGPLKEAIDKILELNKYNNAVPRSELSKELLLTPLSFKDWEDLLKILQEINDGYGVDIKKLTQAYTDLLQQIDDLEHPSEYILIDRYLGTDTAKKLVAENDQLKDIKVHTLKTKLFEKQLQASNIGYAQVIKDNLDELTNIYLAIQPNISHEPIWKFLSNQLHTIEASKQRQIEPYIQEIWQDTLQYIAAHSLGNYCQQQEYQRHDEWHIGSIRSELESDTTLDVGKKETLISLLESTDAKIKELKEDAKKAEWSNNGIETNPHTVLEQCYAQTLAPGELKDITHLFALAHPLKKAVYTHIQESYRNSSLDKPLLAVLEGIPDLEEYKAMYETNPQVCTEIIGKILFAVYGYSQSNYTRESNNLVIAGDDFANKRNTAVIPALQYFSSGEHAGIFSQQRIQNLVEQSPRYQLEQQEDILNDKTIFGEEEKKYLLEDLTDKAFKKVSTIDTKIKEEKGKLTTLKNDESNFNTLVYSSDSSDLRKAINMLKDEGGFTGINQNDLVGKILGGLVGNIDKVRTNLLLLTTDSLNPPAWYQQRVTTQSKIIEAKKEEKEEVATSYKRTIESYIEAKVTPINNAIELHNNILGNNTMAKIDYIIFRGISTKELDKDQAEEKINTLIEEVHKKVTTLDTSLDSLKGDKKYVEYIKNKEAYTTLKKNYSQTFLEETLESETKE